MNVNQRGIKEMTNEELNIELIRRWYTTEDCTNIIQEKINRCELSNPKVDKDTIKFK